MDGPHTTDAIVHVSPLFASPVPSFFLLLSAEGESSLMKDNLN